MARDRMGLDYETFSHKNVTHCGVSRYARHSSTEVLMAAWSLNDTVQEQWIPAEGEPMPALFREAILDPEVEKWAWNAPFEINISRHALGLPIDVTQWRDTMVLALTCSLPGKLEKAGPVVGLDESELKSNEGRSLIRLFSGVQAATKKLPRRRVYWHQSHEKWVRFLEYNARDEVSERAIYRLLKAYQPSEEEWGLWHYDQHINEAGIPVNMDMVRNAIRIYESTKRKMLAEMAELTGLDNPNSNKQLLTWLNDNGYRFTDLKAGHVKRGIEVSRHNRGAAVDDGPNTLEKVLGLRSEVSRTSPTKYHALERAVDDDGQLRYALQFAGAARTWRWAGRIWQPQNLPRPVKRFEKKMEHHARMIEKLDFESFDLVYDRNMDVLASGIRPAVQAPPGYFLIDADLNAIENRVLGWLADCRKILRVFELGRDPYIDFATYLFGQPYEVLWAEYKGGNGEKRTVAKPGVLGCGYMLGPGEERVNRQTGEKEATGLLGYAWNMGITEFTTDQSKLSVETFRREYVEVKDYWYGVEKAMRRTIRTGQKTEFGFIEFDKKGPFTRMRLPSGRYLHYCRARIENVRAPWGEIKPTITYEELNDRKQWVRGSTHPGKITENADQAISRDLLAHGMLKARARGLDLRLHVHDQAIGLVREERADEALAILRECMEDTPRWAPGLPLGSAGFTSRVFMKD